MRAAVRRLALATCVGLAAGPVAAQEVYEVVRPFADYPRAPHNAVEGSDGKLYLTAVRGGAYDRGVVVSLRRNPGGVMTPTVLHHFSGPDGSAPAGELVEVGGVLYGTTYLGGAHGLGTIFSLTRAGAFTLLHSFDGVNGAAPRTRLVLAADGHLYGTSDSSTVFYPHTIFRATLDGTVTVLHRFTGQASPGNLVVASDGHLYGTTDDSANGAGGTIFRLTLDGVFTVLHTFSRAGLHRPTSWLVQASDGSLYGLTIEATLEDPYLRALFRITLDGALTFVRVFDTAAEFVGSLIAVPDGTLYATIDNRVCRMSLSGVCTTIRTFTPLEGWGGLAAATGDGRLVVAAGFGGLAERGAITLITTTGALTDWYSVADPEPLDPTGPLLLAPDGSFYGTSCRGGVFNLGTIFRMTPSGGVTTLHSFAFFDGACPTSGLVRGTDGLLYGASRLGGLFGVGTLYRIGPAGGLQVLHTFTNADGANPNRLVQTANGLFYGTTERGGALNAGTIFRMTSTGSMTVLHAFDANVAPYGRPKSGLTLASDGNLYGTTCSNPGAAFRMTPEGVFTGLPQSFWPLCSMSELIEGVDGHLFGTSMQGSSWGSISAVAGRRPLAPPRFRVGWT